MAHLKPIQTTSMPSYTAIHRLHRLYMPYIKCSTCCC